MGVSVSALLSELECQPQEFIVDPWVSERVTLVAEQQARVTAAAHLVRYFTDERAGQAYRGAGVIRWLLFWPHAPAGSPYWPDATEAAQALITACIRQLEDWQVTSQGAEGELPVPGVYGVPAQWPHIRALYERAGFAHTGHTEVVHLARVEDLPHPAMPPLAGLSARRSVGINGTRLSAVLDTLIPDRREIGYIEVEVIEEGERLSRRSGWADIGNLHVITQYRRQGVGTWLLGQAAAWLRLARVERLLSYTSLQDEEPAGQYDSATREFMAASGFVELTQTSRGWTRPPGLLGRVRLVLGDLGMDVVHVEVANGLDDLLKRGSGQRAGLGEHEDAIPERHQRRDRRNLRRAGQPLVGVGVDLAERDVLVLLAGRLEDWSEHPAWPAP
jgi:GNAT superfamily N-acetyltransferase